MALNHVPSYSGVLSLRVAQLLNCRKGVNFSYLVNAVACCHVRSLAFSTCADPAILRTELRGSQQNEDTSYDMWNVLQSRSQIDDWDARDSTQEGQSLNSRQRRKASLKPAGPTKYLLSALRHARHESDSAPHSGAEPTLSYTLHPETMQKQKYGGHKKQSRGCRLSLQTVVADYIQFVEPLLTRTFDLRDGKWTSGFSRLDDALKIAFSAENVKYLKNRGYRPMDVVAWAWILRSNNNHQAILRILVLEEDLKMKHGPSSRGVPLFIPLFLLRRSVSDARTFRLLLTYCLHLISGQSPPSPRYRIGSGDSESGIQPESRRQMKSSMEPPTCMSLVIRLLRHARQVWPQAQLPIARAFARYLSDLSIDESNTSKRKSLAEVEFELNRFKTEKFNRLLWLLSLPSKQNPFVSIPIQQRAQFEILKIMASHKPILPVERRGYQGIIAVQLAHKKTPAERQSAELKAPSWPPWKEDKLGIDSERGIEGMESRAIQVMAQMTGAGYSRTRWEEVASILAGWDTDRSPTIQTRALMPRSRSLRGRRPGSPDQEVVWIARIRATRTVREAWACFLSYQDQGFPPRAGIYAAMAEKLIYRKKAIENGFEKTTLALPGDCLEVFPEPASARDVIYVRTEPPTLEDFLQQMFAQGIRPSGRFLALLLRFAPTFNSGLHYLRRSDLPASQIEALCSIPCKLSDYTVRDSRALHELPVYIFAAFIEFLCKSSNFDPLYKAGHDVSTADVFPIAMGEDRVAASKATTLFQHAETSSAAEDIPHPQVLRKAVQLLRLRKTEYSPAWISLLSCLAHDRTSLKFSRSVQRILAWHEISEVFDWMEELQVNSGFRGFMYLCQGFSGAVVAGVVHSDSAARGLAMVRGATWNRKTAHLRRVYETFEDMVHGGLRILKDHFDQLVLPNPRTRLFAPNNGPRPEIEPLPMLHVPFPAALHAFIRALGVAEDSDGLLNLLRWMSQSAASLKEVSDELSNGERMTRRCLVAIRVFLEGSWNQRKWSASAINRTWSFPFNHGFTSESTVSTGGCHNDSLVFSDPIVQEAHDIIQATPEWGSWPTDEEVQEYISGHGGEDEA